MDQARRPACLEIIVKQCRGGGAIDIIVTKNRDRFASLDRPSDSLRRRLHVHQAIGVGEKILQLWVEMILRIVWRHATPGENAGQEITRSMNLRDGERKHLAPCVEPAAPRPPKHGALDPEKRAGCTKRFVHAGW